MILTMCISAAAFSATVLDSPTYSKNIDGIKYVEKTTTENGSTQKIFYGEYDTTSADAKYQWVLHSIRTDAGTTLSTVKAIAQDYEAQTGNKVMLAVNGDYFSEGEPVDSYVVDGEVVKVGGMSNKNSLGFDNNGIVAIGRMTETNQHIKLYDKSGNHTATLDIDEFNRQPREGQIAIYNTPGTYTVTNAGVRIVTASNTANLNAATVLGTDATMIDGKIAESKTFTLKGSQFAVVYTAAHTNELNKYQYGWKLDLASRPAGNFAGCEWVIGGYSILVNNGVQNTNCHTDNSGDAAAPRTFVGFKADGTGFVCVVDGRGAGGSTGITVNKEAELAKALGAQYALELDGGGSSTMIVRINDTLTLRNSPSDGSMRSVANAILLVEKEHECKSVCEQCGKCTNALCAEDACTSKCGGHHVCESVCPKCQLCLDKACDDTACANKCQDHHTCESVCPKCQLCLDKACDDTACANKCQGHHTCESVCPKCQLCLDKACDDPACANKCQGHHTCESVCPKCQLCLDEACDDPACANKCQGHHTCESVCEECGKCTDSTCDDDACTSKCEGHNVQVEPDNPENPEDPGESDEPIEDPSLPTEPETPDVVPEKQNPFIAFIMSIIEAIKNFFANLFK